MDDNNNITPEQKTTICHHHPWKRLYTGGAGCHDLDGLLLLPTTTADVRPHEWSLKSCHNSQNSTQYK